MEYQYILIFVLIVVNTLFDLIAADCPIVTVPAGGYVLTGCSSRTNSVCSIQCSSTGIVQSQICQPNGLWSGPQFNCFGGNGLIPGGTGYGGNFNNNYGGNYGGNNGGFNGVNNGGFNGVNNGGNYGGNNQGFNLANGQVICPSLIAPVNGYYSGNCAPGIVGGTCVFACRTGTTLRGTSIVSCLSTGTWSGRAPTCASPTRWYVLVRRWFG